MATFFLGTWTARLYLAAVVPATILAACGAPVPVIVLTSPVSIIFAPVFLLGDGWLTGPMFATSVVAGYLLNTVVLNLIAGASSARRPGSPVV